MMLTGLASVLKTAGLDVVEQLGWRERGHGAMTDVRGVTCHHNAAGHTTAPASGPGAVQTGRSDLAGPLAHLFLNRAGVFYVVAAGLCWHAGVSLKSDYTNAHRIGIEAQAAGDGWDQDWPDVQMAAYALGCKALADHYGFATSEVRGHKETCSPAGRKIDPSFPMSGFRLMVNTVTLADLKRLQDEGVMWTTEHKKTATDAKWRGGKEGELWSEGEVIRYPPGVERLRVETKRGLEQVQATLAAQNAVIGQLAAALAVGGSLTAEQAQQAAQDGAEAALHILGTRLSDVDLNDPSA